MRRTGPWLVDTITTHLAREKLPFDALGTLDANNCAVAKTASRHVLGVMNDMTNHIDHTIAYSGGLAACDIVALNHALRRGLHRQNGDYIRPIDLAAHQ